MKFCKLFETVKHGQILVVLQRGESGDPEIQWSVKVPEYDVCTINYKFDDNSLGWEAAEKRLEDATAETAFEVAENIIRLLNEQE